MSFALSLLATVLAMAGMGGWWRGPSPSVRVLLGALTILALMLVGNLAVGLPLSDLSRIILAAGAVAWLWRVRRGPWELGRLLHPVLVLPVGLALLVLLRGGIDYLPFAWDEYSAWLRWPREAYVADSFQLAGASWAGLAYPLGLPALLLFPQIFAARFDPALALAPLVAMHAAMLGVAYETVGARLRAAGQDVVLARLGGWAVILALLGVEAAWTLLPQLVAVEKPQIYLFSTVFLLLAQAERDRDGATSLHWGAGALVGGSYLIKATASGLAPGLLLAAVVLGWSGGWRAMAVVAVRLLLPLLAVMALWKGIAPPMGGGNCGSIAASLGSWDGLARLAEMAGRVGQGVADYSRGYKLPLTLAAGAGLAWALLRARAAAVWLLAWGAAYFAGLCVVYGFCYSQYEVELLASLERYWRLVLRIVHVVGLVMLADLLAPWLALRAGSRLARPALLAAVALLAGWQALAAIPRSLDAVQERGRESAWVVDKLRRTRDEAAALARLLDRQGLRSPDLYLIVQNGDGFEQTIAATQGLGDTPGQPPRFTVLPGIAWGEERKTVWTTVLSPDQARARFLAVPVLWPMALDEWSRAVLEPLVPSACRPRLDASFLLRRPDGGGFDCVGK